ncbi:hypothetical protein [Flavobacterium suzhouense]|uniref:Uncharacterized protein n=1 Tax=Flavobacterium suzhouense TaxID=1529638 RepID=A0ABW5NV53_9FLAO
MKEIKKTTVRPKKVHENPRFSVNKLGEYLTATPARRKRLIEDQKYPNTFITSVYKIAREAIIRYIIKDYDESILDKAVAEIKASVSITDQDRDNSLLILKLIRKHSLPDLSSYKKTKYQLKNGNLSIKGLKVSISPDIILRKGNKVGCIKIHIIKTESQRLDTEAGLAVSTLLHQYIGSNIIDEDEKVDPKTCISFDCFNNSYETAPSAIKRRMGNIEAACEEIVLRWDSV